MDSEDRRFMRRAIKLARRGVGIASPNPTVGCVLVRQGRVVGRGWHEYETRDHAEVRAVAEAGLRARGATAYVTLEPCSRFGRTPPCTRLLVEAGVGRVVVAQVDPNPEELGRGIEVLRSSGVQVEVGLLREEAERLNEPFACLAGAGRPLVVGKSAMSLDGKVATATKGDHRISSRESLEFGQSLRLELDAILVGVGTILADNPRLTYRGTRPKGRPLIRVILDRRLRTPLTSRVFRTCPAAPVLLFCGESYSKRRRLQLEEKGAEIIPVAAGASGLALERVLDELAGRRVLGLLVEGGGWTHWSFLSARLVDKFFFLTAPFVLGGRDAVPSVGGPGYRTIRAAPRFAILRSFRLGTDSVLETYPSYSRSILSPWRDPKAVASPKRCFSPSSTTK